MGDTTPRIELRADLIVDTATQGRQRGVRGGDRRGDRRLLYRSGDLFLDLRLSRVEGARGVTVMGQLLGGLDAEPLTDLPIRLDCGDAEPVVTESDHLGEFWMLCERESPATLAVEVERRTRLELSLPAYGFDGEGGTP